MCGAGAAGVELAFGFKKRWGDLFKREIKVSLVCPSHEIYPGEENRYLRQEILRKYEEKNIHVIYDGVVKSLHEDHILLEDGRLIPCLVPVWATGAESQKVTYRSDLEILNGYIKVNDFMQSTSHPEVFAGGDCVSMETYADKKFPPKAGVYAVRAGPYIA